MWTRRRFDRRNDGVLAFRPTEIVTNAVPHRYAVPPQDLTRNAPILQMIDPVEVCFLESLGDNLDLSLANHMLEDPAETHSFAFVVHHLLIDVDEPLELGQRLHELLAAVRNGERLNVFLFPRDASALFQILNECFPSRQDL